MVVHNCPNSSSFISFQTETQYFYSFFALSKKLLVLIIVPIRRELYEDNKRDMPSRYQFSQQNICTTTTTMYYTTSWNEKKLWSTLLAKLQRSTTHLQIWVKIKKKRAILGITTPVCLYTYI